MEDRFLPAARLGSERRGRKKEKRRSEKRRGAARENGSGGGRWRKRCATVVAATCGRRGAPGSVGGGGQAGGQPCCPPDCEARARTPAQSGPVSEAAEQHRRDGNRQPHEAALGMDRLQRRLSGDGLATPIDGERPRRAGGARRAGAGAFPRRRQDPPSTSPASRHGTATQLDKGTPEARPPAPHSLSPFCGKRARARRCEAAVRRGAEPEREHVERARATRRREKAGGARPRFR